VTSLLDRFEVVTAAAASPTWVVKLDDTPLLHLSDNHVGVNDLRTANRFHWGFALLRNPWTEPPRLQEADGAVHLFAGQRRVAIMQWHEERPAHVEVKVFDLDHRLLDLEVRYRQLPASGVLHTQPAPSLGR
jgi:hypothetical protein